MALKSTSLATGGDKKFECPAICQPGPSRFSSCASRIPLTFLLTILCFQPAHADENPSDWSFHQAIDVSQTGMTRVALPLDTISHAQASLADVRVMDPSGTEVSFFTDEWMTSPSLEQPLGPMTTSLNPHQTVIQGTIPEIISRQGVTGMVLFSATDRFLKAVSAETSTDRLHWTTIIKNGPVYKQPDVPTATRLDWPRQSAHYLRVTLDDTVTPAIQIERIDVLSDPAPAPKQESVQAQILETTNDARDTLLLLLLPADHLSLDSIQFQVTDATFYRPVRLAFDAFLNGDIRESTAAQGFMSRVALGSKSSESLSVPVHEQLPGRQLIVHIHNGDSLPLTITSVSAMVAPDDLIFNASTVGRYTLWVGNAMATPRTYDVTQLREPIALLQAHNITAGPLEPNAAYHAPTVAPELQSEGGDIDVSSWHYRRKVELASSSAGPINRIELDLPTIAHNAGRLEALRLVRGGKQIPYVIEPVVISRETDLVFTPLPSQNHISRWQLTLPVAPLMVNTIDFTVDDPLFQRGVRLYEDVQDERGDTVHQLLIQDTWHQTPSSLSDRQSITLNHVLAATTLTLEIDDGDNQPLHPKTAKMAYPVPRLLFPALPGAPLYFYYGQQDTSAPQYDLSLIADQILATPPTDAHLGAEEILNATPWYQVPLPAGGMRWIFWTVLGLVVAGLLFVIAKLLPEESSRLN